MALPQDAEPWKAKYDQILVDFTSLKKQNLRLQQEYGELKRKVEEASNEAAPTPVTSPIEFEETLKRLVMRVAMILQAEKCAFLLLDRDTGELVATPPAFGFSNPELALLRVQSTEGVSGLVFRTGNPEIVASYKDEPRALPDVVEALSLRNGSCVPLIIEKRDEDNRVTERTSIGVLHVFNKRYSSTFTAEDVKLLSVLARNAAAVIAQAQLFLQVEERVKEVEATIESSPFGVLMVNMHGAITQMNACARDVLRADSDKIGSAYEQVIVDGHVRDAVEHALKFAEESQDEITVHIGGEEFQHERHYQIQTALVRGEGDDPIGVLAAFNDITEIRNVERMKTAFVSTVSHELRTPMTGIQGFVQTLLDDPDEEYFDRESRQEFYSIINQECERLKRMINNLLNVSRIERGLVLEMDWSMVNLEQLIDKVVRVQQSSTNKHTLMYEVQVGIAPIKADMDKVDQILQNLINNAIKYSPNGGEIKVTATYDNEKVRVAVSDQGLGIPKEQLPKVFEKFSRVENEDRKGIPGTGIGLFLTKSFVARHGGKIDVESQFGKGSTFSFTLSFNPPEDVPQSA